MLSRVTRTTALLLIVLIQFGLVSNVTAQRQSRREVRWVNPDVPEGKGLQHKILASKSLKNDVGYVVWTPPQFDSSGKTRYPVVYFLHGAGGSEASDAHGFSSMIAAGIRQKIVPPAICVFPNGGMSGYRGGVESMIVDELIPLIDEDYPTTAAATSRVIAGFSMGGAGSVRLSILHPDLFCGAGSWAGALSFRGNPADSPLLPAAQENAKTLRDNGFSMLLINGDKDRPTAFQLLAERLESVGVAHEVRVLDDTDHNLGKYHQRSGDAMIEFLGRQLRRAAGRQIAQLPDSEEILLLVRSDDMGAAHAMNLACIETVTDGIARSVEVIVPAPWFLEAVELLKRHPGIDVGVHLDLTSEWTLVKWGPVSKDTPSLVDANGHFYPATRQRDGYPANTGFLESEWKLSEVERELRAQIELALKHLPNVTHLSAHMGTAVASPELRSLVDRLAKDYDLPIELPNVKQIRVPGANLATPQEKEAALIKLLEGLKPGLWMLVEHPALDTPEMRAIHHKGYENVASDRAGVTHALTSKDVLETVKRRRIKLISYADLVPVK
jgi:predicted glycoside hydrolase/deacetylase ChbG (UPF0249 family)/enterochelin esterase-like enzyme